MLLTLLGILLLASGSSALNQLQERHIDAKMARTANRPLPTGRLSPNAALVFIIVTLVLGLAVLARLDLWIALLGLIAVVSYNGLYTLWWKKHWAYAAIPGAIPGALPILMGFTSANGAILAPGGIYLFLILFYWQMPHFWVLALRYSKDYEAGGFPTLPVTHGTHLTVLQIVLWCLAYIGLLLVAPLFLPVKAAYLVITLAITIKVLLELRRFALQPESQHWLHFFLWVNFSLIIVLGAAVLDLYTAFTF